MHARLYALRAHQMSLHRDLPYAAHMQRLLITVGMLLSLVGRLLWR
jgi:hypothetical protein